MSICLSMIVRDEEQSIAGCLRSALPVVDTWLICDTGSVDKTKDAALEVLDGVPGSWVDTEWVGFGANRTECLRLAAREADYMLMLDADMRLEQHGDLPELTLDEYMVRSAGSFEFTLPLLLKSGREWGYKGAAHSYLVCTDGLPISWAELEELRVVDTREGGFREGKFERDRLLLEAELEADPSNARACFYLAQTYRDLGWTERAEEMYGRRVGMGGWDEEVFWARYQRALCIQALGGDTFVPWMLDCYESRPTRVEPLYVLAKHWLERGRPACALLLAEHGCTLPPPPDRLFILRWMYDGGIQNIRDRALEALGRRT